MLTTKQCYKCTKTKPIEFFTKLRSSKDGHQPMCTVCRNKDKKEYRRSLKGMSSEIYLHQKRASEMRGHPLPTYTMRELREWLLSNNNFHKLHKFWVASDYEKDLTPSVDRIDIDKSYTMDNIQLMTWKENRAKGHIERCSDKRICYKVKQVDINGIIVGVYPSMRGAARRTGICFDTIRGCVAGEYRQAGGYIWEKI